MAIASLAINLSEEFLEPPLQGLKRGPWFRVVSPTLQHDLIQGIGTLTGARHAVAGWDCLQDLCISHARVGELPVGDYLVQEDTKGPHIGLDGEAVVEDSLRSSPLDGNLMDGKSNRNRSSITDSVARFVNTHWHNSQ